MTAHNYTINELVSHVYGAVHDILKLDSKGFYVLMLPRQNKVWLGIGQQECIRYQHDEFIIEAQGKTTERVSCGQPYDMLHQVLDKDGNYFFMISPDLHRPGAVSELPTMIWSRAEVEIEIDANSEAPYETKSQTANAVDLITRLNQHCQDQVIQKLTLPEQMQSLNWKANSDKDFLVKLNQAIQALQEIDGKVIVTRSYSTDVPQSLDLFRLYQIYNMLEPACAASHYFSIDAELCSLGCTPENIFTLRDAVLDFDVVAATRGISSDPVEDRRWKVELETDPKELKEHDMALARYRSRLAGLCEADSVTMDHYHEIREFRYVRHLYSHVFGKLKSSVDFWSLIKDSSPALCTYPKELIPVADDGVSEMKFYGGIVGRAGHGFNEADVFLNIRSVLYDHASISTLGGVGVVRESIAEQELIEVRNKLRCLKEACALWAGEAG